MTLAPALARPARFVGVTWEAALRKARAALGREAVILESRRVTRRGPFGLPRGTAVEITAAAGVRLARDPVPTPAPAPALPEPGRGAPEAPAPAPGISVLQDEVRDLRAAVQELLERARRRPSVRAPAPVGPDATVVTAVTDGPAFAEAADLLRASRADDEVVRKLLQVLRENVSPDASRETVRERLRAYVEALLPTSGPIFAPPVGAPPVGPPPAAGGAARRVALVGPTGVGKTTTLAKLAAAAALRDRRRVGLLTMDTYRIAAVEQLGRYAEILGAPVRTAHSPADLARDADALAGEGLDLLLLDTAGRSPRDEIRLRELSAFLEAFRPDETHLVLAAPTASSALLGALRRFGRFSPGRILLTKLDEAERYGFVLDVAARSRLPFSYLATGQDVPEDLEVAAPGRLARLVLGEERIG